MTTKTHIVKVEEAQVERAIQMRTDNPPSPTDKQIWFNENDGTLSVKAGGSVKNINLRILAGDPTSPQPRDHWINTTTNQLKYVDGSGITQSISMGTSTPESSDSGGGAYYRTLTEAELRTLSDVTLSYPNYIIDAFNSVKPDISYTNASVSGSRLRPTVVDTTLVYDRTDIMSSNINHSEGIIVGSFQALAPSLVSNLSGSTILYFYGDLSGFLESGKDMLAYQIVNSNGVDKDIYALDEEGRPNRFEITNVNYDSINERTEVTLANPEDFDLTFSYGTPTEHYEYVRFYQYDIEVSASGSGSGTLVPLPLEEAHGLETVNILGETRIKDLERMLAGSVHDIVVQHSANKTYWLIGLRCHRTGATSDDHCLAYSIDGLKTIQLAESFSSPGITNGASEVNTNLTDYNGNLSANAFNKLTMQVSDEGRWIFCHRNYNGTNYAAKGWFGKMSGVSFEWKAVPKSHGLDGEFSITSGATNMYEYQTVMDWDNNCLAVHLLNQTGVPAYDPYILFYTFDWTLLTARYLNYVSLGSNMATSYSPPIIFWKTFESERMLFIATTNNNGFQYAFKIRQYNVLNYTTAYSTDIGLISMAGPTGTFATLLTAFTDVVVAGTRNVRSEFTHVLGATGRTLAWCFNGDETELLILKGDDTSPAIYLVTLNFSRTTAGTGSVYNYSMSAAPTSGTYTISVNNTRTAVTNTTAALAYNATAAQIKTALELLAVVGSGNATVTGDYLSGFNITFAVRDPLIVSFPAHTMGGATTIFIGSYTNGTSPVWLTHPVSTNTTTVYQYSTLGSIILLDTTTATLWGYTESNISSNMYGRSSMTQKMCAVGDTVYIIADLVHTDNDVDAARSTFMKIPNFKELRGLHTVANTGTNTPVAIGNTALGAGYGTKLAYLLTIPTNANTGVVSNLSSGYYDGYIPFRGISLLISNSYLTQKTHNPTHKIKLYLYPVSGGLPDTSGSPIAESVYGVPEVAFTPYDDFKWYQFNFNDLRVNPGAQYALVIAGNWDAASASEINPTGLLATTRGITQFGAAAGAGMCRLNDAGTTWSTMAYTLFYKLFDYYYMKTSDAQENSLYQTPCQLNNAATNEDSESSIAFIGNKSNRRLRVIYRNSDWTQSNSTSYTGEGSHAKTFVGEIDDSADQYDFPIFSEPTLLGDNGQADPHLVFGVNFGSEDSRYMDPRTKTVIYPGLVSGSTTYTHEGYCQRAYGGVRLDTVSSSNMYAPMTRTSALDGIEANSSFESGKCLRFNGTGYAMYRYGTYGMFPGPKDFCIEFEYLPHATDLDGTQNILVSHEGAYRVEIQSGRWQMLLWGNPSETWSFRATEAMLAVYQRVRMGRTFAGGFFIQVSYDSGETWQSLTIGVGNPASVSGGRVLGLQGTYYDQIWFGRYADGLTAYVCYGAMGYFKYCIGVSEPAYDGPIRMDIETDFRRILNFGDKVMAMRLVQNTAGTNLVNNFAEASLIYPDQNTSKVETKDQMLKFKQSVPTGNRPSFKLEFSKKTQDDPVSVQGLLFNFEKK